MKTYEIDLGNGVTLNAYRDLPDYVNLSEFPTYETFGGFVVNLECGLIELCKVAGVYRDVDYAVPQGWLNERRASGDTARYVWFYDNRRDRICGRPLRVDALIRLYRKRVSSAIYRGLPR